MKKFFGVVGLIFCAFLASCNFNTFSDKSGNLEFSISKNDIAQLVSQHAFRSGDGEATEIQELLIFVQIKGSKGYYAYKSQTVGIEYSKEENKKNQEETSENNESVDEDYAYSEESIQMLQTVFKDANIVFNKIPVNQTYTVMFDLFVKQVFDDGIIEEKQDSDVEKPEYAAAVQRLQAQASTLICSGKTNNVTVSANQTNQVDVDAVLKQKDVLSLKVEFEDNTTRIFSNNPDEEKNQENDWLELIKENGELYNVKPKANSDGTLTSERKKVTNISFVLADDSNFTDSWVKYLLYCIVGNYTDESKGEPVQELKTEALTFINGVCSLKELLLANDNFSPVLFSVDSNGFSFINPSPNFYVISASKEENNTNTNTDTDHINQEIHGSLISEAISEEGVQTAQTLVFSKRQNLEEKNRFIYAASLSQILGDKTLNQGDTVVFVMKIPGGTNNQTLEFSQFYYELQESKWADIDNDILFENNECINCDNYPAQNGYYTFVMPLNFIQSPSKNDTVLFFFDEEKGTSETTESEILLPVLSLEYHIFPASTKTFVFGLGQNWTGDNNPYRYEFKLPLADVKKQMLDLVEDDDVSVRITGTVKYYGSDTSVNLDLTSEIYDGACYDITDRYEKKGNNDYYHPLSNTEGNAINDKVRAVSNGVIAGDGYFNFGSIQKPFYDYDASGDNPTEPNVSHNYQFQCYTPCTEDPSVLLTIQGFNIVATHTAD